MVIRAFCFGLCVTLVGCGDAQQAGPGTDRETGAASESMAVAKAPGRVTLYRDAFGTPQVFADSNYGVFFGYGYAVASDRLFQMEMLKRTARGVPWRCSIACKNARLSRSLLKSA